MNLSKSVRKFLKNVYTIEPDEEMGSATYFILWDGDIGCNGGSATPSFMISEVGRFTESRPFLVLNNDAFGEDFSKNINSRFIEKLQKIIAEVLNLSEEEIRPDSTFVDDLGADSLDVFQIIMGIEEEFDIEIDNEEAEKITTVQDAVDQIKKAVE